MIWTDEAIAERIAHAASLDDARRVLYRFQDRLTFDLLESRGQTTESRGQTTVLSGENRGLSPVFKTVVCPRFSPRFSRFSPGFPATLHSFPPPSVAPHFFTTRRREHEIRIFYCNTRNFLHGICRRPRRIQPRQAQQEQARSATCQHDAIGQRCGFGQIDLGRRRIRDRRCGRERSRCRRERHGNRRPGGQHQRHNRGRRPVRAHGS